MSNQPNILVVDDEATNLQMIKQILQDEYHLVFAKNGEKAIELAQEQTPDLILMDVMMPEMDGLEACKRLKSDSQTSAIPVIFVSALSANAEIMSGYEAGGDDYITKPFDQKQLLAKVKALLKFREQLETESQGKQVATDLAMSVMTSAAENGQIVQFMKALIDVTTLNEVRDLLIETLKNLDVNASALAVINNEKQLLELGNLIRPIEKDVLFEVYDKMPEKIKTVGNKCIFKTEKCVLLIREMPEDSDKAGRYRDHLAVLIDSLDAKIKQFEESEKKLAHYKRLAAITEKTFEQLTEIRNGYQQHRVANSKVLNKLHINLEKLYMGLGLSEEQETALSELVEEAEKDSDDIYEKGAQSLQIFDQIINNLKQLHDQ